MKSKINLYVALFVLSISLITFIGFGYLDSISDNLFKIDNVGTHFYPFYLVNSFVGILVYYIGPWIIIPGVFNIVIIFKEFHKSHLTFFIFFQLFSLLFFLLISFFTFDFFIGKELSGYLDIRFKVPFNLFIFAWNLFRLVFG